MTLHQGINQEVALMYIRYALSLGASSSEILIIAQASFRLVRAPTLGKEVQTRELFPDTQIIAQTTQVCEERGRNTPVTST